MCEAEIQGRIAMAKDAFNRRRELLTKHMNRDLRKRIIKSVVWSLALYGSETWTLKKKKREKLEAFEMWTWHNMEKISWQDHKTNEYVLEAVGEKRKLLDMIMERKRKWLGHLLGVGSLVKDVLEGRLEGRRGRGRPRIMLLDDIKGEDSYASLKRRAMDRVSWSFIPRTCPRAEHR